MHLSFPRGMSSTMFGSTSEIEGPMELNEQGGQRFVDGSGGRVLRRRVNERLAIFSGITEAHPDRMARALHGIHVPN